MIQSADKIYDANNASNTQKSLDIVFQNITYDVEIMRNQDEFKPPCKREYQNKSILKGITGIAKGGQMTAIMGASGAGKTTLLNVIACRIPCNRKEEKKVGVANGQLYINKKSYDFQEFGNFANYVMQDDILLQSLTVRETLEYVGGLTLTMPETDRKHKIEEITKNLKLQKCIDTLVGGTLLKGISGGERKRTSIAFELMSDPQIVILDEPTSGLDSLTAYIICSYLHKLAKNQNKTVVMTIHQPNSEIFQLFDRLLFLIQGRCVYQGRAFQVVDYFSQIGFICPEFSNPPDYIMSIMHHQSKTNVNNYPLYFETYDKKLKSIVEAEIANQSEWEVPTSRGQKPGICQRLGAILKRDFLNTSRNPLVVKARIIQSIILGLLTGGVYFAVDKDYNERKNVTTILGMFFFFCMTAFMGALSPVSIVFPKERLVFLKEQGSRLYGTSLFALSRNIVEAPYLIIIPLIMMLIFYWMIGLGGTVGQFFTFYLIFFLISFAGNSLGLLLGSMVSNAQLVSILVPIMILPFVLFSGFFKNREDLPVWLFWLQYISPLKYAFMAFIQNQIVEQEDQAGAKVIENLSFEEALTQWPAIFILLGLSLFFRAISILFLWAKRTRLQ